MARKVIRISSYVGIALVGVLLGCQRPDAAVTPNNPQPEPQAQTQSRTPARSQPKETPATQPAKTPEAQPPSSASTQSSESSAAHSSKETAPVESPASVDDSDAGAKPKPAETPRYLTLLARQNSDQNHMLTAETKAPSSLTVTTNNVRRFRLTREGVDLNPRGSIVLRVDGQVFEWTRHVRDIVFEYSADAGWTIVETVRTDR